MLGQVLGFVDDDPEALLDRDTELDEVQRIEPHGTREPFGQRRLVADVSHAVRLELQAAHEQALQLVQDFLGFHGPIFTRSARAKRRTRQRPVKLQESTPAARASSSAMSGPHANVSPARLRATSSSADTPVAGRARSAGGPGWSSAQAAASTSGRLARLRARA